MSIYGHFLTKNEYHFFYDMNVLLRPIPVLLTYERWLLVKEAACRDQHVQETIKSDGNTTLSCLAV